MSVGLYVGGTPSEASPKGLTVEREAMRRAPPDILLTNYLALYAAAIARRRLAVVLDCAEPS